MLPTQKSLLNSLSALASLRVVNQELIILFIILQFLTNIPSKLTIS